MNEITKLNNSCAAMTTKEIADLTEKRHDHVIRDTENMLNELGEGLPKFGGTYKSTQGKDVKCYILPKDLTLTLVSGYNIKMRKAIINRWEELENNQTKSITQLSRLEILEMAIDSEKKLIALKEVKEVLETNLTTAKEEIENIKPMAEYGHNIFISSNLYTVTNIGQMIGLSGAALNRHLKRLHVIRKGTGKYTDWELCARYMKQGLVEYKETPGLSSTTGEKITHRALRWTRKGHDWLVANGDLVKNPARKSLPLPKQELIKRGA